MQLLFQLKLEVLKNVDFLVKEFLPLHFFVIAVLIILKIPVSGIRLEHF